MSKTIRSWYVNRRQVNATEHKKKKYNFALISYCVYFLIPTPPLPHLNPILFHRTETNYRKAGESKRWASFNVKLFTNNQSESEKMSLAGESSGGRWGSGGSVCGRAGMGGVMSASGMWRSRRGGGGSRDLGCGFSFVWPRRGAAEEGWGEGRKAWRVEQGAGGCLRWVREKEKKNPS